MVLALAAQDTPLAMEAIKAVQELLGRSIAYVRCFLPRATTTATTPTGSTAHPAGSGVFTISLGRNAAGGNVGAGLSCVGGAGG